MEAVTQYRLSGFTAVPGAYLTGKAYYRLLISLSNDLADTQRRGISSAELLVFPLIGVWNQRSSVATS